ncbi:hypothetical protein RJT34_09544 [Clitoria ternatea]|uniref:Phosphorylated adapter RNA export protein n=1 Tax=Clitoria ternatea TaxID=43366 RepID=A0AAN9K5W1_CLITE
MTRRFAAVLPTNQSLCRLLVRHAIECPNGVIFGTFLVITNTNIKSYHYFGSELFPQSLHLQRNLHSFEYYFFIVYVLFALPLLFNSIRFLTRAYRKSHTIRAMEDGDSILDAIYEEDNLDDVDDDVDMIDVEEGELVEPDSQNVLGQCSAVDINEPNPEPHSKNSRRKAKKKKNKRKRKGSGSNAVDINRFVLDTCRRLKEKKSYMVYTAVGCLGVQALSDLIKEVDAIQTCGGQKTADGRRFRTGGGILWGILKVREPKVYKEIMKKAREFEKQFRQPNVKQRLMAMKEDSSQGVPVSFAGRDQSNVSDGDFIASPVQNQHTSATTEENLIPVHDRLRIPVSYDDDLLRENPVNDAT